MAFLQYFKSMLSIRFDHKNSFKVFWDNAMTSRYYEEKLSALRLKQCYEIAPRRVQQYLEAEINHVLDRTRPEDHLLELGCGYGRVLPPLAEKAGFVIGIDTSHPNLLLGQETTSSGNPSALPNPEERSSSQVIPINFGITDWNGSSSSPMPDSSEKSTLKKQATV